MAGVFPPVELEWRGRFYTVQPHRVMGLLVALERHVSLGEIHAYSLRGASPVATFCQAYGAMLRYAGAHVRDEDVFAFAMHDGHFQAVADAIKELTWLMIPPAERARLREAAASGEEIAAPEAEIAEGNAPPAAAGSKRPTKRQSAKAGSRRPSSGASTRTSGGGSTKRAARGKPSAG